MFGIATYWLNFHKIGWAVVANGYCQLVGYNDEEMSEKRQDVTKARGMKLGAEAADAALATWTFALATGEALG